MISLLKCRFSAGSSSIKSSKWISDNDRVWDNFLYDGYTVAYTVSRRKPIYAKNELDLFTLFVFDTILTCEVVANKHTDQWRN